MSYRYKASNKRGLPASVDDIDDFAGANDITWLLAMYYFTVDNIKYRVNRCNNPTAAWFSRWARDSYQQHAASDNVVPDHRGQAQLTSYNAVARANLDKRDGNMAWP